MDGMPDDSSVRDLMCGLLGYISPPSPSGLKSVGFMMESPSDILEYISPTEVSLISYLHFYYNSQFVKVVERVKEIVLRRIISIT
jgi:hypothetical protein